MNILLEKVGQLLTLETANVEAAEGLNLLCG